MQNIKNIIIFFLAFLVVVLTAVVFFLAGKLSATQPATPDLSQEASSVENMRVYADSVLENYRLKKKHFAQNGGNSNMFNRDLAESFIINDFATEKTAKNQGLTFSKNQSSIAISDQYLNCMEIVPRSEDITLTKGFADEGFCTTKTY